MGAEDLAEPSALRGDVQVRTVQIVENLTQRGPLQGVYRPQIKIWNF
jgi:hypothetical protein